MEREYYQMKVDLEAAYERIAELERRERERDQRDQAPLARAGAMGTGI